MFHVPEANAKTGFYFRAVFNVVVNVLGDFRVGF
jgi:hypothetical protein